MPSALSFGNAFGLVKGAEVSGTNLKIAKKKIGHDAVRRNHTYRYPIMLTLDPGSTSQNQICNTLKRPRQNASVSQSIPDRNAALIKRPRTEPATSAPQQLVPDSTLGTLTPVQRQESCTESAKSDSKSSISDSKPSPHVKPAADLHMKLAADGNTTMLDSVRSWFSGLTGEQAKRMVWTFYGNPYDIWIDAKFQVKRSGTQISITAVGHGVRNFTAPKKPPVLSRRTVRSS
jgi:hypothetical protein